MASEQMGTHPCEARKPLEPWKADHLYIDDRGQILCGRCMGVESTYRPWCWSDLGVMGEDRTVVTPPMFIEVAKGRLVLQGATAHRCETDRYAIRRTVN